MKRDKDTDLSAYIKSTSKDIGKMFEEVMDLISGIENKHLKQLLELFMGDEEFEESYKTSTVLSFELTIVYYHDIHICVWILVNNLKNVAAFNGIKVI